MALLAHGNYLEATIRNNATYPLNPLSFRRSPIRRPSAATRGPASTTLPREPGPPPAQRPQVVHVTNDPINLLDVAGVQSNSSGGACSYARNLCQQYPDGSTARCRCDCTAIKVCEQEKGCGLPVICQGNTRQASSDAGISECAAKAAQAEATCQRGCLPVCSK